MFRRIVLSRMFQIGLVLVLSATSTGCRMFSGERVSDRIPAQNMPNPLTVPQYDRALIMDQISDELDNYFRIFKEERIRIVDSLKTEGWIETHPKIGATLLEPWHRDSTPGFERLQSTLQTIRRFAKVRVIPTNNSYLIDVKVFKELEDKPAPQSATSSGRQLRHDNALDIDREDISLTGSSGWIPLGRDISLENRILKNIQARINEHCR